MYQTIKGDKYMLLKIVRIWGGTFFFGSLLNVLGDADFFTFSLKDKDGNCIYADKDAHITCGLFPFPCIFHYKNGGDDSSHPFFRITRVFKEEEFSDYIPESLRTFLLEQSPKQIECYEACCTPLEKTMHYFTHPWAMDRMVENRIVSVASGIFEPENLSPINGEIGVNTVVAQEMNFHDSVYLSANVARFQMDDFSKPAKAWFVSVYDPAVNAGKNAECNQVKRAIIVYWHFIPDQCFVELLSGELYIETPDIKPNESLHPLFTPQK